MNILHPPRHFPSLPKELEQGIFHMMTKEDLFNNPDLQRDYWEPLRRDRKLPASKSLAHIEITYPITGGQPQMKLHSTAPPDSPVAY